MTARTSTPQARRRSWVAGAGFGGLIRWFTGAMLCAAAAGGLAQADVVAAGGRPPAVGVTISDLRDGQLHYRLSTGRQVSRPLEQIEYLQVTGWPLFNLAEKQHRDGHFRQAANSYEKLLAELTQAEPASGSPEGAPNTSAPRPPGIGRLDRALLVRCRLLRACDGQGRFDRAVALYLEVIEQMPAGLESLRPAKLPASGSTFLRSALSHVNAAIERYGQGPIAVSLSRWRNTWPGQGGRDDWASEPGPGTTRPAESPAVRRVREVLREARALVEAGRFDEALSGIEPLQTGSAGRYRPDVYYWQGRALLGKSMKNGSQEADRDRRRAGLAFMRVVIHFPGHFCAPECLFRAGRICAQAGQGDRAAGLWSELVQAYPRAGPWADLARQELGRMEK